MLVREHPWLQVHVSEVGAPHLVDPSKLEASARGSTAMRFDALWGELAPVPAQNVHVVGRPRSSGSTASRRPGTRGTTSRTSMPTARSTPATQPACGSAGAHSSCRRARRPEFDLEAWEQTIDGDRASRARPARAHPLRRVRRRPGAPGGLRETLARWARSGSRTGWTRQTFVAAARYDVSQIDPELADDYDRAGPYWHHYRGIERYWRKRREAARLVYPLLSACASRSASETNSSAEACVASSTTGGATPASSASCQRAATTHQRSPGTRPGNIHCGCGVTRSFPRTPRTRGTPRSSPRRPRGSRGRALGAAVAVAEVSGHRVEGARLELAAEDVHEPSP